MWWGMKSKLRAIKAKVIRGCQGWVEVGECIWYDVGTTSRTQLYWLNKITQ